MEMKGSSLSAQAAARQLGRHQGLAGPNILWQVRLWTRSKKRTGEICGPIFEAQALKHQSDSRLKTWPDKNTPAVTHR